jgi:hypothetical protein
MTQEQIDKHFTTLFNLYPSTNVMVYSDLLVFYKIPYGMNIKIQDELNALIMEHNLPLVAKSNGSNQLFMDTVLVTVKEK